MGVLGVGVGVLVEASSLDTEHQVASGGSGQLHGISSISLRTHRLMEVWLCKSMNEKQWKALWVLVR